MTRKYSNRHSHTAFDKAKIAVIPAFALATSLGAHAFTIDTENEDLAVRFDTQVRLTAGQRVQGQSSKYLTNPSVDETESRFNKGDLFTKRIDLLGDLDVTYKRRHGFRISGAGWADGAYDSSSRSAITGGGNYANDKLGADAKKYVKGPGGEILDAFIFTGFDIDSSSVALKAGKHTVYWGESLFAVADSIAYSQGPINTIKAASNPGSEAKELFMPTNQLSAQLQVNDNLSFAAQYSLDWRSYRLVPGGTYFAPGDAVRADYAVTAAEQLGGVSPFGGPLQIGSDLNPKKRGDYGLSMRWKPEDIDGTFGFYYRQFSDGVPWAVISTQMVPSSVLGGGMMPNYGNIPYLGVLGGSNELRSVYGRDTKLIGVSYSANVLGTSLGAETSYRHNAALRATPFAVQSGTGDSEYLNARGPQGNTLHALVNAISTLKQGSLWDQGIVAAELSFTRLQSISYNPADALTLLTSISNNPLAPQFSNVFQGAGNAACDVSDRPKQCATRDAWNLNVAFTPQWNQVLPSWDVSLPMTLGYGLKGTAATLAGSVEGRTSWSLGVSAAYMQRYFYQLRYSDFREKDSPLATNVQNSHGNLIFTFKTSF